MQEYAQGRVAPGIFEDVQLPRRLRCRLSDALEKHSLGAFLAAYAAPQPEYRWLVAALARYRAGRRPGWPVPGSNSAHRKDRGAAAPPTHDPSQTTFAGIENPSANDLRCREAIQALNGLAQDGRVRGETLAANIATERVRRSQQHERWRWLPSIRGP
jgi:murein L,D-transpeptidase YcbB/YkuD